MKLLAFSDIHISKDSGISDTTESGYTRYHDLILKSCEFVRATASDLNVDAVAFLGDCFHSASFVDTRSLSLSGKCFTLFSDFPGKKIALVGNHDFYSTSCALHSLEFLKSSGWLVADTERFMQLGCRKVLLAPFSSSAHLSLEDAALVLSHNEIIGSVRRQLKGPSDIKALSDKGVDPSTFNHVTVLNGHYHSPSFIPESIYNIGSLLCRDFSDKGSPLRGLVVLDLDSLKLSRVNNPHAEYFSEVFLTGENSSQEDLSRSHVKIYYALGREEEAKSVADNAISAWMYPLSEDFVSVNESCVEASFSLEVNLSRFIHNLWGDDSELEELGLDILKEAGESPKFSPAASVDFGFIEIRGFQSIGYALVDLHRKGLVLLRGENLDDSSQDDNGSGKSTFAADSIYWCLTGKSLRGLKGDEVIGWNQAGCSVALELYVGGKVLTQVRSRKDEVHGTGSKVFPCALSDIENVDPISARKTASATEQILSLIGRDEKSLKQIAFMSSDDSGRFTKLGHDRRARLLEDILGAYPYRMAKEVAAARISNVSAEVFTLDGSLTSSISTRKELEERLSKLESEIADIDEKVRSQNESSSVPTITAEISKLELENKKLRENSQHSSKTCEQLQSKVASYENEISQLTKKISSVRVEVCAVSADIDKVKASLSRSLCPECGEETNVPKNKSKLGELEGHLREIKKDLQHPLGALQEREVRLSHLREQLVRHTDSIISSNRDIEDITAKISMLERRRLKAELEVSAVENELSFKKEEACKMTTLIASNIAKEHEAAKALSEKKEYLLRLRRLSDVVFSESGVRNLLLAEVALPFINSILAISSLKIVGRGLSLTASRALKNGTRKNEIDVLESEGHTYSANSCGERARVDMCIQLALGDLATATGRSRLGYLVVDEVLGNIDSLGSKLICDYLEEKEDRTVILTTHGIPQTGGKVWTARKQNGVTSICT